jgi:hypothetical protein
MTTTSSLILFREIIAVYCEYQMKHIHTLFGQSTELLNVKTGGTYSYHRPLKNQCLFCTKSEPCDSCVFSAPHPHPGGGGPFLCHTLCKTS